MRNAVLLTAAALMLVACGPSEPVEPLTGKGFLQGPMEPAPKAQGFATRNSAPEGAEDTKGDGVLRDADGRPFQYALLGEQLPDFTAPTADGATFTSADINRWTVIDVWGAWCGDCVRDAPYADALQRAIAQDPDLDFLTIHVPASTARATPEEMFGKYGSLDAYFADVGFTLPTVLDTDGSLREALKISWTPTYLLVSPDRVVRGFRSDLSVDDDQPVKTFLQDVAEVRKNVRDLLGADVSDLE
ncbi:MAG: TlpA family protein disulfide reductase [Hyphomonas sp.]